MENVILVIHLILALALIGIVLVQRSEGGGLGIGGGGGGVMSARGAATALGKLTWFFAIAFLATSIALTVLAARDAAEGSVLDTAGVPLAPTTEDGTAPALPDVSDLLPDVGTDSGELDLAPPPVDEDITPPAAD